MRKLRWTEVDRPSLLSTKFCGPNCCASTSRLLLVFTNNNSQSEPIARVLWSPCVSRAEANRNDSRCEQSLLVWLSFPLDTRYTRLFGKAGYVLAVWCVRVCACVSGYQHCTTGVNAVNTNLSVQVGAVVVVVGFGYQTRANGYRRFVGSGQFRSRRLVRRRRIPVRLHAARTKQTAGRKLNLSSPTTSSSTAKVDVCLFEMWFAVRWERHVTLPQFVWQRFVPSVWLAMTQRVVSYKTLSSRRRASTVKLNTSL